MSPSHGLVLRSCSEVGKVWRRTKVVEPIFRGRIPWDCQLVITLPDETVLSLLFFYAIGIHCELLEDGLPNGRGCYPLPQPQDYWSITEEIDRFLYTSIS